MLAIFFLTAPSPLKFRQKPVHSFFYLVIERFYVINGTRDDVDTHSDRIVDTLILLFKLGALRGGECATKTVCSETRSSLWNHAFRRSKPK
jgi:hypothetical protein